MHDFELRMLKQYFQNIIDACDNKKIDERPYIKSVAEGGVSVINGLFNNNKPYV